MLDLIRETRDKGLQGIVLTDHPHLSIASYLIKVGLGDSPNLRRLLVQAERALALYGS